MISSVLYSSKSGVWETPQPFFDELDDEFHFDLDSCALPENAKCKNFYTPEQDGLQQPWYGTVWCNPPYGRSVWKWIDKAQREVTGGVRKWLSCCCRHEPTRFGFISIYTTKRMWNFVS